LKNHYQVLGVESNAGEDEIKRAYRNKAKKLHPDIAGDDPAKRRLFEQVTKAYEVLSNEDLRKAYDEALAGRSVKAGTQKEKGTGKQKAVTPEDFSGLFEEFFGKSVQPAPGKQNNTQKIRTDEMYQSFFRFK